MSSTRQHKSHLSRKLLKQIRIIDTYKARIAELDAEYANEIIRLAAIRHLEDHKY
jgi:hypothetical protein